MSREPDQSWTFRDVVFEAHMRAAITRRRYHVWWDPRNRLWCLNETLARVGVPR